jgi:hypothetical protein
VGRWSERRPDDGYVARRIGYATPPAPTASTGEAPAENAPQQARPSLTDTALFDDEYERDEFLQACRDFEDAGETSVDYQLLMKWADAGLLECEHFTITAAWNAEIERIDRSVKRRLSTSSRSCGSNATPCSHATEVPKGMGHQCPAAGRFRSE